jgi:hypothetical protein
MSTTTTTNNTAATVINNWFTDKKTIKKLVKVAAAAVNTNYNTKEEVMSVKGIFRARLTRTGAFETDMAGGQEGPTFQLQYGIVLSELSKISV